MTLFLTHRNPAKTLRWNSQSTVELAGQILKCDESRELDNGVFFKMFLEPFHQVFLNRAGMERDGFSVFKRDTLRLTKEVGLLPGSNCFDLAEGNALLEERGGVYVDTEAATVKL